MNVNSAFSAGLGRNGRIAAWLVAFAAAGAWKYNENKDNFQVFSPEEQKKWNAEKKKADDAANNTTSAKE